MVYLAFGFLKTKSQLGSNSSDAAFLFPFKQLMLFAGSSTNRLGFRIPIGPQSLLVERGKEIEDSLLQCDAAVRIGVVR